MSERVVRDAVVRLASGVAAVCAILVLALHKVRALSFLTASRLMALCPGAFGVRLRRHWYRMTLTACGPHLVVEWLSAFKTPGVRVGSRVFVGSMCWIAEANLGDDVMVGARAAIQGGPDTHTFERLDVAINRQPGAVSAITIGSDVWIGTGATVMADVSPGTVVGAGAVVTRTFPPRSVIAGVPAHVIRERGRAGAGER
jgi:acetyltransferase-like isoleucine patch superfamily enzyme